MINWVNMSTAGKLFLPGVLLMLFLACIDIPEMNELQLISSEAEYAIPLINSKLTLESVLANNLENVAIHYDENGVAVVAYSADVAKKRANDIFKPIVFPGPFVFEDSVVQIHFDQIDNYIVEKGTFRGDSIRFGFTSVFNEDIQVSMRIKEASKEGEFFKKEIVIPANSSIVSPLYSLKAYDFISPDNLLSFTYEARKASGERVLLENTYFEFTYFVFDFVQGYLGESVQKLKEQNININVFDLWENGSLEFFDPKIIVRLDNSFGFPVKAVINHFEITNLSGETIPLESTIFDEDIFFDYPSLDEIGEVKSSVFTFDKTNSNFATAFNKKVTRISYDIDAQANPENNQSQSGFFTFDSYYLLNVGVELPMRFKADAFQMADHFPLNTSFTTTPDFDLVKEVELKAFITNLFPVDVYVQLYFLDDQKVKIDSVFEEGEMHFPAAIINPDGSIVPGSKAKPFYIHYDRNRKAILEQAKRIAPYVRFSTINGPGEWTSITKDQGLEFKIGAKFIFN